NTWRSPGPPLPPAPGPTEITIVFLRSGSFRAPLYCAPSQLKEQPMATEAPDRKRMIELLNDDLSREYQAVIAYVVYSQVLKGAQYMNIAKELEKHAGEELSHAITVAKHIDYLGGTPVTVPKPV